MSLNSYLKIYDDNNLKNLNAQKNLIEENANKNIADLNAEGELAKKETEASYEGLINTQNVQRLINEKKVAETMANLGLSDSGLNRTQQTAVQLSHSNAVAQLQLQRQKKVDEIARLVQQQVGAVKTQLSQDLMKTQSAYDQSKTQWAGEQYNAQLEAETELKKAQLEAEAKAIAEIKKQQTADNSTKNSFALAWNTDGATTENITLLKTNMELYPQDTTWQKPAQNHITALANNKNTSEADMVEWVNRYTTAYGTDQFIYDLTHSLEFIEHFNFDVTTGDVSKKIGRSYGTIDTANNTYNYVDDKGRAQTVYGIGSDATMDGVDILDALTSSLSTQKDPASEIQEQLFDAFRTGGMEQFMKARQDAIEKGYSGYSIDHLMNQKYGDLWLLAAAKNDNYKGLSDSEIVKLTDDGGTNWGWFFDGGKDQDAEISIKGNTKSVKDIFDKYNNKDLIKKSVLNKILAQYGG